MAKQRCCGVQFGLCVMWLLHTNVDPTKRKMLEVQQMQQEVVRMHARVQRVHPATHGNKSNIVLNVNSVTVFCECFHSSNRVCPGRVHVLAGMVFVSAED